MSLECSAISMTSIVASHCVEVLTDVAREAAKASALSSALFVATEHGEGNSPQLRPFDVSAVDGDIDTHQLGAWCQ